jgi:hypothetical protein
MPKLLSALVGVSMLGLAGAASAGEPVNLTNDQLDIVTAGVSLTGGSSTAFTGGIGTSTVSMATTTNRYDTRSKRRHRRCCFSGEFHTCGESAGLLKPTTFSCQKALAPLRREDLIKSCEGSELSHGNRGSFPAIFVSPASLL